MDQPWMLSLGTPPSHRATATRASKFWPGSRSTGYRNWPAIKRLPIHGQLMNQDHGGTGTEIARGLLGSRGLYRRTASGRAGIQPRRNTVSPSSATTAPTGSSVKEPFLPRAATDGIQAYLGALIVGLRPLLSNLERSVGAMGQTPRPLSLFATHTAAQTLSARKWPNRWMRNPWTDLSGQCRRLRPYGIATSSCPGANLGQRHSPTLAVLTRM